MDPTQKVYDALVTDVLNYVDIPGSGYRLLNFLDERGDRVTLRLSPEACARLLETVQQGPGPSPGLPD